MSRKIIYYRPDLKEKSRELRKHATTAERKLWRYIRRKQLKGYQFYRQKPIGNYIVDFFCFELMLVIEIDGITHNDKETYDNDRDNQLHKQGIHVLHFFDSEVHENLESVLQSIVDWIENFENNN